MGVYIKNWTLADWKELLKWVKIGANNAMIGEFAEVEEIPPHGDLIERDALRQAVNDFPYGYRGMILAKVAIAPTIIPESKEN